MFFYQEIKSKTCCTRSYDLNLVSGLSDSVSKYKTITFKKQLVVATYASVTLYNI